MKAQKPGIIYPLTAALIVACILALAFFFLSKYHNVEKPSQEDASSQSTHNSTSQNTSLQSSEVFLLPKELSFKDPSELVTYFNETLYDGDDAKLHQVLNITVPQSVKDCLAQFEGKELVVEELGELEINKHSRWSLHDKSTNQEIILDLKTQSQSLWYISAIQLLDQGKTTYSSLDGDDESNSLNVAKQFLDALTQQDYSKSMSLIDPERVSGARIAALCSMFEEGQYALPRRKPLRALFRRKGVSGYMANLTVPNRDEKGQFGITLKKNEANLKWEVVEVNLNNLLSDHIKRIAESDAYYTPLVKTPTGGDNLVIYFDTNDTSLTERATRQLAIVAQILKSNQNRIITLGGHTDDIGSDAHNDALSLARALEVKKRLLSNDVKESQIKVIAYGESMPVLSNDSDIGRKINRRAEIFLDF